MYKNNLGDQIKDIVEDAVNTCDYQDLNRKIKNTAMRAIDEFNVATNSFVARNLEKPEDSEYRYKYRYNCGDRKTDKCERKYGNYANSNLTRNQYAYQQNKSKGEYPYNTVQSRQRPTAVKIKGRTASILYTVFGGLGTGMFGIAAFVLFCVFFAGGCTAPVLSILGTIFSIVAVVSIGLLGIGSRKRKYIARCKLYYSLMQKNKFCTLKRMSEVVDKPINRVIKDLRNMMIDGMFPEGHFDDQMTCFIQNDETYRQYLATQESYKQRIQESAKEQTTETEQKEKSNQENEELRQAIVAGKEYMQQIRKANDDISGEEISLKLDRLEQLIGKIFLCVEKHPTKLAEIRKFMEYYLPITIKLVNAYKEFDSQPIQGENIKNSKVEIEATLDTIDHAFETLLDSLYEDEAMEVSSDISVLNALFAQEGLSKKDFDMKKES